ncbi:cob(I)yrinic acid a,c-diamide adenosyltransferase [Candidatus Uhrbacteria bacterium]|nr:cob(I)yrinic acid a,c-diamide adenosyltransferase [Candidatus Uhrbacteria bacterium]
MPHEETPRQERWGLIQIYTGNGKGKTTAALGVALRAAAVGRRVAVVAFDKGGDHYSERTILAERIPEIEVFPTGLDRIDPETRTFRFGVTDDDRREGERGLRIAERLFAEGRHDLIVLDEANIATTLGILREEDVLRVLDLRPDDVELILTGREAPQSFLARADLISEIRPTAHYFSRGNIARKGIDY